MAMAWRGVEGEARAYGLAAMPLVLPLVSSRRSGTEGFAGGAMGVETSCSRRWCTSTTEPSQGERTETSGEDVEEVSVVEEDFDRKVFTVAGCHFLDVHLETAIPVDVDD